MLETMLTTPKFIPKTWVKEYDRLHKEALKKTQGINWAKILLFYPKQRSFEDGEADIYGNFTRAHRSYWIVGCILGPTDSKSFEETEKEKNLNCLFLETDVMEEAKKVKGSKRPRQKRENRQPGAADEPNSGRSVLTEEISKLQEPPSTPEQPSSLISDSSATTETPSVTGR
ncbi:unnamed protein product [Nippostrongylus brasiliensis]|uniref:DUF1738 domain-containing protein n=1 Tax=Nippostrongylus brasiliensis TaxID=27835 RepID=A0A0N4XDS0_NIPBR|nr:unnamed protein product [Nippostrongylus brasiliensis]